MDLMVFSLHVAGLSSLVGSLNFIVTFMRYFLFSFFSLFGFFSFFSFLSLINLHLFGFINYSLAQSKAWSGFYGLALIAAKGIASDSRYSIAPMARRLRAPQSCARVTNVLRSYSSGSNFLVYNY